MRSDRERLYDIFEAIEKIEQYKSEHKLVFESDELLQIWIVHYLQIIGEAASRISHEMREQYPEIPWGKIIGTRHVLVHGYFDIDLDLVWAAVDVDLPVLKTQIRGILEAFNNQVDV